MRIPENLKAILREGESYTVEFKESPDKALSSEVCAFANAFDGKVYIGVHDDGYIVGTDTNNNDVSIGRQSAANRSQSVTPADRKQAITTFLEKNIQGKVSDFVNIIDLSDGRVRAFIYKVRRMHHNHGYRDNSDISG